MSSTASENSSLPQASIFTRSLPFCVLLAGLMLTASLWQGLKIEGTQKALQTLAQDHALQTLALSEAISQRTQQARQMAETLRITQDQAPFIFDQQGSNLLRTYPDLLALGWISRITEAQRLQLVSESKDPLAVWANGDQGRGPVNPAAHYWLFRKTLTEDKVPILTGLDLASMPHWQTALDQALNKQQASAAASSLLPGIAPDTIAVPPPVVQLFLPIYAAGSDAPSALALTIDPQRLGSLRTAARTQPGIVSELFDLDQNSNQPLFSSRSLHRSSSETLIADAALRSSIPFADRSWMLVSTPTARFLKPAASNRLNLVTLAGLIATLLATALAQLWVHRHHDALRRYARLERLLAREQQALQNKTIEKTVLNRALSDSEQRTRDFIALGSAFACELDENFHIGYISTQIHDLIGLPPAELAGTALAAIMTSAEQPRLAAAFAACQQDQTDISIDTELAPASTAIPITLRLRPVRDALGRCVGYRALGWRR